MKLLHISPSYYPAFRFGGPVQSVHLLNKALVKRGVNVDVITTSSGMSKERMNEWLNDCMKYDGWCHFDGVRVKYLNFIGYEHYNFSLQIIKEIWKIIENYDLVHITAVWNFPVLASSIISLIKKKPYIISPRGVFHQEAFNSKSVSIKKLYFNLFAKHYLKKAAAIHYTSEVEKQESEKILKHNKSFILPNGIDINRIAQSAESKADFVNKKYILFLGRIDRIKGLDLLIPAFANVNAKLNDLKLVIAGDDTTFYAQEVSKIIEALKISDKITFTGQVTGNEKWSLYKNALMFVMPSYSENFGMSVVEAMACGCPVVISDKVGIYKEVSDNNAGIIVQTTVQSVEEGILKLLNNEKIRMTIAANASAMVEKYYDIDKVAEQMIIQYKNICDFHLGKNKPRISQFDSN
ncbi:MAG: glycosyltransferase [Ignavibacterium album]|uniref:glycosyltransferase n=1 Tax=Ignavibacterium album TaxID=591197 RepID=UPI0026EB9857|nr:glycosyltransferase [Ignavibacterium album]MCX8104704.1 glycosyltransferase [Ignavibacterium album]